MTRNYRLDSREAVLGACGGAGLVLVAVAEYTVGVLTTAALSSVVEFGTAPRPGLGVEELLPLAVPGLVAGGLLAGSAVLGMVEIERPLLTLGIGAAVPSILAFCTWLVVFVSGGASEAVALSFSATGAIVLAYVAITFLVGATAVFVVSIVTLATGYLVGSFAFRQALYLDTVVE